MTRRTYHSLIPKTVYFIRPIGMRGPIKIGCSLSPDGRRSTLESWCPFPLEVVAEVSGNHWMERQFHTLFADQLQRREWFAWSPRLQTVIDAINAGTFDVATLPEPKPIVGRGRRDLSFMTDGWRYMRSVESRIRYLRRRGLPYAEAERAGIRAVNLDRAGPEAIEAARQHFEPLIADWQRRFPLKPKAAAA